MECDGYKEIIYFNQDSERTDSHESFKELSNNILVLVGLIKMIKLF